MDGTVIMAGLFIWAYFQDKTKNSKLLEENTAIVKTLSQSNENIAKSLDIISNNMITLDVKADRNYQELLKK